MSWLSFTFGGDELLLFLWPKTKNNAATMPIAATPEAAKATEV